MGQKERFIQRCLDLAVLGGGQVSPNPMVGVVLVPEDTILGERFTSPFGGSQAAITAIQQVIDRVGENSASAYFKSSTLYVSLEPCAHFGKTPPCVDRIIELGFPSVVVACKIPLRK